MTGDKAGTETQLTQTSDTPVNIASIVPNATLVHLMGRVAKVSHPYQSKYQTFLSQT